MGIPQTCRAMYTAKHLWNTLFWYQRQECLVSEAKPEWSVAVSPVSEMWYIRNLERVVVINYFNGK